MPALILVEILRRIVNSERFGEVVAARMGREPRHEAMEAAGPGLLGRMARGMLVLFVFSGVVWVAAQLLARRLTVGDESSDEFRVAVLMGGDEFYSFAGQLRSGRAITVMGGLLLDLRDATIDPSGARLELQTTMGGVEVRVPQSWRVEVEQQVSAGEFQVDVADADALPEDAPTLRIYATTRIGSGYVTARNG